MKGRQLTSQALPLAGCRVLVTRPRHQAGALLARLRELGAEPLALPAIAIEPEPDSAALDAAIAGLAGFDWVVFTSANAVRLFCDRLAALGRPSRELATRRVAAIGPRTAAALVAEGVTPEFVPDSYIAEAVTAGLAARGVAGAAVLLPRAAVAREVLPEGLRALGARVTVIPLYTTTTPPPEGAEALLARVLAGEVEYLTFTSSSTVRGFAELLGPIRLPAAVRVAAIGPITAATAREVLGRVDVQANSYTVEGLVDALIADRSR